MRLLTTRRNLSQIGTITKKSQNNDISVPQHEGVKDLGMTLNNGETIGNGMSGEGFLSGISNFIAGDKETYRPGFKGEHHAILKLKNGFSKANYMGPGTNLNARLVRGDPPRTLSDKVAQRHDIDYGLAKSQTDVSNADRRMIASLKKLKKEKRGNRFNIEMGLRPIQAKLALESRGLIKPGRIASFGDIQDGAIKNLAIAKRDELEQEGFGMPVDMLRAKLIAKMVKARKARKTKTCKSGKGLALPGGGLALPGGGVVSDLKKKFGNLNKKQMAKKLSIFVLEKLVPILIKKLQSGTGLKLAGAGAKIRKNKKINSMVYMKMLKRMNDGASRNGNEILGNGIIPSGKKLKEMSKDVAKMILPILISVVANKANKRIKGMGRTMRQSDFNNFKKPLLSKLTEGVLKSLFGFFKKQAGFGKITIQDGEGFFGDFVKGFKKGFMMVANPALKVAKTLAPLAPMLL